MRLPGMAGLVENHRRCLRTAGLRFMDFRISAFVGPLAALRGWNSHVASAVAVALTDDLGLVPVTDAFLQDLGRHLKAEGKSENEVIRLWGVQASRDCTLAYLSADSFADFYSDGIQYALAWANQQAVQSELSINDALRLLGVQSVAGESEFNAVDLSRYPDTESWAAAAMLDQAVGGKGGAVPALIKALKDRGSDPVQVAVRRNAAEALGRQGPAARKAVPALVESAGTDPDLYVRQQASRTLGLIGREAVADLLKLLKHSDGLTRADAATALGNIGKDARKALPALVAALHDREDLVRLVTARAVARMYIADKKLTAAFRALVESATRDSSDSVRISAIRALASVGPEAVPTLIQVLGNDSNRIARQDAADALQDIGRIGGTGSQS